MPSIKVLSTITIEDIPAGYDMTDGTSLGIEMPFEITLPRPITFSPRENANDTNLTSTVILDGITMPDWISDSEVFCTDETVVRGNAKQYTLFLYYDMASHPEVGAEDVKTFCAHLVDVLIANEPNPREVIIVETGRSSAEGLQREAEYTARIAKLLEQ